MPKQTLSDKQIKDVLKLNLTVRATKDKLRELHGKACNSDRLKELKIVLEKEQKAQKKHKKSTPKPKPEAKTDEIEQEMEQKAQKSTKKAQTKYAKLKEKYDFLLDSNAKLLLENQELLNQSNESILSIIEAKMLEKIFNSYIKQYRSVNKSNGFATVEVAALVYKKITGKDHPTPLTPPPKKAKMKLVKA